MSTSTPDGPSPDDRADHTDRTGRRVPETVRSTLQELWEGESLLAAELAALAGRTAEPGVAAAAERLAAVSRGPAAWILGLLAARPRTGPATARRERCAAPAGVRPGRSAADGRALLADLRRVHALAGDNALLWDALCCAAPATGDRALLDLAAVCRPRTAEQLRWSRSTLRSRAAQALTGRAVPWRRSAAVLFAVERADDPGGSLLPDGAGTG
ncbi:hypothetical protein [Streptomyces sp. NRRL B-24484]|uniref:hypothetical protein n=1 Tax=Streptomyces sp. NRRL B-24484 TaxID=1463833 RepID=UPI0004C092D0|nr:hypothetical protein [Streptomyces sp. NRRL B-24484]